MPENPLQFALYFISSFGFLLCLISYVYGRKNRTKPAIYFAYLAAVISAVLFGIAHYLVV